MKFTLAFLFVFSTAMTALAQESPKPVHQQTTLPTNARFEVVQSSLAVRYTFGLDRYSGRVWQLVRTKEDENIWEETPVRELPRGQQSTRPRYQLFTSGFAVRHTFLLDTDTGKTWLIVVVKLKNPDGTEYDQNVWQPFAE